MEHFNTLTASELAELLQAPGLIVLLIGTVDGKLDQEERTWAERLIQSRTYNKPAVLNNFYQAVYDGFWDRLDLQIAMLPAEKAARHALLETELAELNPILNKLEPAIGAKLYHGFLTLAEETAKASGGFLRIGAIDETEQRWLQLPMLTPIHAAAREIEADEAEEE